MADLSNPLDQIEVAQANPATTANELFDAGSPAMIFGRRNRTTSGLTWGYYGGRYRGIAIAHGTIALPASEANVYIVAAKATGVVSQSTSITNWNDSTNYDRQYWAMTGPSTITDHDDYREVVSSAGAGVATIDTEIIQDIVGALLTAGSNISLNYNDGDSPPTLSITGTASAAPLTQEQVEDIVGSLITAGSGISKQYNDGDSPATLVLSASGGSGPDTETIEDIVANLITAGSGITKQYNDGDSPATLVLTASGGGGTPGGADTNVQYNNAGAFGGTSALTWTVASLTFSLHSGTGITPAIITTPTQVTAATDGPPLTIRTGVGNTTGAGGALTVQAGAGGVTSGAGGALALVAGSGGVTNGAGGVLTINAGAGVGTGGGGPLDITGGAAATNIAGAVSFKGGTSSDAGGGDCTVQGGNGSATSGGGGALTLSGGAGRNGGFVHITAGSSAADGFDGGSVLITAGNDLSSAVAGTIRFQKAASTRVATLHTETGFLNLGATTTDPGVMLAVESDVIRLTTAKTPASAGAAGVTGDMCWDANYQYVCVATNTWKRAAHATW